MSSGSEKKVSRVFLDVLADMVTCVATNVTRITDFNSHTHVFRSRWNEGTLLFSDNCRQFEHTWDMTSINNSSLYANGRRSFCHRFSYALKMPVKSILYLTQTKGHCCFSPIYYIYDRVLQHECTIHIMLLPLVVIDAICGVTVMKGNVSTWSVD